MPSLAFPESGGFPDLEKLPGFEAVRLLVERTAAVSPGFHLTSENAASVAQICRRLDGIPLAIELAAARTRMLNVEQIAARLDNAFRLLTGGSKTALPRQQTLKATIDWSYDLLSLTERLLLQRLSVFSGGWDLEAAESVCTDENGQENCAAEVITDVEMIDLLAQLVDKSLVITETQPDGTRYRLLETIHQYARDYLMESRCSATLHDRHLAYFARLSGVAEPHLRGWGMVEWLERLDQELENLRAALDWSLLSHIELGLKIAVDLMWFWHSRARFDEELKFLDRLLAAEANERGQQLLTAERALQRARGLRALAYVADYTNYKPWSEQLRIFQQSIAMLRALGSPARRELGITLELFMTRQVDLDLPADLRKETLDILENEDKGFYLAEYYFCRTGFYLFRGDQQKAKTSVEKSLALCQAIGDADGISSRKSVLSRIVLEEGNYTLAETLLIEAIEDIRKVKNRWQEAVLHTSLASLALAQGNYAEASRLAEEALSRFRAVNYINQQNGALVIRQKTTWSRGDFALSIRCGHETLQILGAHRDGHMSAYLYMARAAISQGDQVQAEMQLTQALLNFASRNGFRSHETIFLLICGAFYCLKNDFGSATQMLGAVDVDYQKTALSLAPRERSEHDENLAACRAALGEAAFAAAFAVGQAMTIDQAMLQVAGMLDSSSL